MKWQNTNKLLKINKNFNGLKTGITPSAGPCLAASYQKMDPSDRKKGYHFVIILLASRSQDERWSDVLALVDWAIERK